MTSILSQCCVVLVEPTLPENVGAVARAMNNMGVKTLRLVNPCDHLSLPALNLAAHSQSILQTASCYERLEDAIADVRFVVGTTVGITEQIGTETEQLCPCIEGFLAEALTRWPADPLFERMEHRLGIGAGVDTQQAEVVDRELQPGLTGFRVQCTEKVLSGLQAVGDR